MKDLNLFDVNCTVGRHLKWRGGEPHTAEDLLAEMDRYGIAEAMVLDCLSREHHPADGNPRALEAASASPRLHAAWSALPHGAPEEQPDPEELISQMRRHRVGALYLFPNQYEFGLSDWCVDSLLEPLSEVPVPVVISSVRIARDIERAQDGTDWDAVVALCRRWPTLPVVVSERRIRRSQRKLYRALEACGNLRLEISCYWLYRGIEFVTRRWGAHRLIFGSDWPTFGQHMTLATLACAEIEDEEKLKIAGDNWRGLIGWCGAEHPKFEPEPPPDEYAEFGRTGRRPAAIRILDCHGHLGGRSSDYHVPDGGLDATVREMDRLDVEKCCVFSLSGVRSDETCGNDLVAEAVRRYPGRFVGFTLVNPNRGPEEMLRELERGAGMGLCGVKLIPYYQGYDEEGPNIDVACRWAHERRTLILNHNWGSARQMERLVRTYPDACFLTGHSTAAYADLMRRCENLYVCSCPLLGPRACEDLVAAVGADRLLFGSDLQDLPIAWGLGPILFALISPEEKRLILGGNLERLLARYGPQDAEAS